MKATRTKKIILITLLAIGFASFTFQSKFFEVAKQIEIYTSLFKELNMYYVNEINPAELTTKAIKNTLENLDPYTNYYNEQEVEAAKIRSEGEYGGIGATVRSNQNEITVVSVFKGLSANKAGIEIGDVIVKINNQSLNELKDEDVSGLLLGIPGSEVSLQILRGNKALNFTLKREEIAVNPVPFYDMISDDTGYIVLTAFNEKAAEEVKKAFLNLKERGLKKLIFDLRGNPGGSLMESIRISNFFLPQKSIIVSTKAKIKKWSNIYTAQEEAIDLETPIVVLINGRSASASEIVAGALQDYDRAVIMGQRSYGKGLVQRYRPLSYGTQLKVTISKYYTPSGRCIQELDYANRLPNGDVPKFSDQGINQFTTKNGRTVFDGGGILPDIKLGLSELNKETELLLQTPALFNFAGVYKTQNPSLTAWEAYQVSESDFQKFINYLKDDTSFVSEQERSFKEAFQSINTEDSKSISKDYGRLMASLKENKLNAITQNKEQVKSVLKELIVERYGYESGVYSNKIKTDKTIQEALSLLNNDKQYTAVLSPKK
ncbi:peptidase S41 [Polaribacter pacificus]|uniref:Peptidase S41 n=1 Tax=Polaribacter pacificus TaxID=1775173 RepID=A0A917HVX1_9FLAO|nr:S41 family peptidase [Polaribacter pacificus]GGG93603.1 peptidase S41 [Polaribacter pacificus]